MPLEFSELAEGKILVVEATGKLSKSDYEQFVPETERLIKEFGNIRVLFEMHDFHGWEMAGVWEDMKFGSTTNDVRGLRKWCDWI